VCQAIFNVTLIEKQKKGSSLSQVPLFLPRESPLNCGDQVDRGLTLSIGVRARMLPDGLVQNALLNLAVRVKPKGNNNIDIIKTGCHFFRRRYGKRSENNYLVYGKVCYSANREVENC